MLYINFPFIPDKYQHYPSEYISYYLDNQKLGFGSLISIFMFMFIFYFVYSGRFKLKSEIVYANFAMIGYILMVFFYRFGTVGRLSIPLVIIVALLVPHIIGKFRYNGSRLIVTGYFTIMFSSLFIYGLLRGSHNSVPYESILFQ